MIALVMVAANLSNIVLLPRFGPKPLITVGMLLSACAMARPTRIGVHSVTYPQSSARCCPPGPALVW